MGNHLSNLTKSGEVMSRFSRMATDGSQGQQQYVNTWGKE